jgi:hypothetical protein
VIYMIFYPTGSVAVNSYQVLPKTPVPNTMKMYK